MRMLLVGYCLLAGFPLRLGYEAPSTCPDVAEFQDRVRARLRQSRIEKPGEEGRQFDVRVSREGEGLVARLFIDDPEHRRAIRELRAGSCDELVDAMALVLALAIDAPEGELAPDPPPVRPSLSPLPAPSPLWPAANPSAAPSPAPVVTAESESPPPISAEPQPAPPPPLPEQPRAIAASTEEPATSPIPAPKPKTRGQLRLGLRVATGSAAAPEPLFGGHAFLGWESPAAIELRGFAGWLEGQAVDAGPGRARFRLMTGGVEACGTSLTPLHGLDLGPCLSVEAGALRAEGISGGAIVEGREAFRFWAAAKVLGQLRWRAGRLAAEVSGGAVIPLVREAFVFESPHAVIHETPAFGWTLQAGGSLSFP